MLTKCTRTLFVHSLLSFTDSRRFSSCSLLPLGPSCPREEEGSVLGLSPAFQRAKPCCRRRWTAGLQIPLQLSWGVSYILERVSPEQK